MRERLGSEYHDRMSPRLDCSERAGLGIHLERREKCTLRDLDLAELAHSLLALLLLLQQLALAADVAAIALGGNILGERADRLARDDAAADRGLDGDLEQLLGDQVLQLLADAAAAP